MVRSVKITTPIPSLEEFGKSLGLSKARQKSLLQIMTGGESRRRSASGYKGLASRIELNTGSKRAVKGR